MERWLPSVSDTFVMPISTHDLSLKLIQISTTWDKDTMDTYLPQALAGMPQSITTKSRWDDWDDLARLMAFSEICEAYHHMEPSKHIRGIPLPEDPVMKRQVNAVSRIHPNAGEHVRTAYHRKKHRQMLERADGGRQWKDDDDAAWTDKSADEDEDCDDYPFQLSRPGSTAVQVDDPVPTAPDLDLDPKRLSHTSPPDMDLPPRHPSTCGFYDGYLSEDWTIYGCMSCGWSRCTSSGIVDNVSAAPAIPSTSR